MPTTAARSEADAEAELELREHEEELLGVEIEITPAGKSTKRLSLLSGGEKSMTALAFLFAVFLARPCPFYILDEVEAALDDLNLDRFLALLRRYSDRAQFIVITHQKRTMEAADWLYGVSMGGDGVSKVISRRLPAERADGAEVAEVAERRPRSPERPRCYRRAARGARLERSVHHRRGSPLRAISTAPPKGSGQAPAPGASSAACARAWPRPARRSASEIQATLFGVLDEQTWERLEEALIMADVGASTTASVVGTLEAEAGEGKIEGGEALSERLIALLAETARVGDGRIDIRAEPTVILAVGVNGTGKTTTIGKLAWHLRHELGRSVLLAGGRHVQGGGRRAARRLGAEGGLRDRDRDRRARTRARSPSRRSPRPAAGAWTW